MNTELLLRVRDKILLHPEQFSALAFNYAERKCIGGHAIDLSGGTDFTFSAAKAVLDLDTRQASKLLIFTDWPQTYKDQYFVCGYKAAANYISYFIYVNGGSDMLPQLYVPSKSFLQQVYEERGKHEYETFARGEGLHTPKSL